MKKRLQVLNMNCMTSVGYNHHDIIAETLHIGKVSTSYAFEVAQRAGHHSVKREILLLKAVYRRIVDWSNLRLLSLDVQLIQRICHQLRYLNLSGNMLARIPEEINLLSKVSLYMVTPFLMKLMCMATKNKHN